MKRWREPGATAYAALQPDDEIRYRVGKVAARFGPSYSAVRNQPYHDTLEAFLALLDLERIEALERAQEQLRGATLTNAALNAPKHLEREIRSHEQRLERAPLERAEPKIDRLDWPGEPNYRPPPADRPRNVRVQRTPRRVR